MAKKKQKRQPRQYLLYSKAAIKPMLLAIDSFNSVYGDYRVESTLILLTNAWELLAKAILIKKRKNIFKDNEKTQTISCEECIKQLLNNKELDQNQAEIIQQIISLRNKSVHDILPPVPEAIQHHLFFFSCKFFKDLVCKHFKSLEAELNKNFLTISFDQLTTYATQVQSAVSKLRRGSNNSRELVWLLERGVRFLDEGKYVSQTDFENLYKSKKKIGPHLKISEHLENADMVCVIPIQAPKNFTADIQLRKGSKNLKGSLPVTIKKSNVEEDYPFLTSDLAKNLGKDQNFTAKMIAVLNLKDKSDYHQAIKTSRSSKTHHYSQKAYEELSSKLKKNPDFNPYKEGNS